MMVRFTSDKSPKWILEPATAARESKHVRNVPDDLAARAIAAQEAYWQATWELDQWRKEHP